MLTESIRAICPFFYVNGIMINLIAVSGIEKYLLKNLNPVFFGTDYEIVRVKVYEKKEKSNFKVRVVQLQLVMLAGR